MRKIFCALTGLLCLLGAPARADLHDPQNAADYLILSTDSLIQHSWIGDLVAWRSAQGRTARAIAVETIYDEFGDGTPSDTVLRDFLFYARAHWSPPQLKDVFIVGWHDLVPTHFVDPIPGDTTHFSEYITDQFFVSPPDSEAFRPLLSMGRLPWSPRWGVLLPDYYAKVVAYESEPAGDWQTRVHLIAEQDYNAGTNWAAMAEHLAALLPETWSATRDYVTYPPNDPWHGDSASVLQHWNAGNVLTFYNGSFAFGPLALAERWSDTLRLDSTHLAQCANGNRLPIVFGTACEADSLRLSPLVAALFYNPAGGAIGMFAVSGAGYIGSNHALRYHALAVALNSEVRTLGAFWRETVRGISPMTANHYLLLGDPALLLPRTQAAAEEPVTPLPVKIKLVGNYPNPFNATTNIVFELPQAAEVSLRVFDITGREVARLVDGFRYGGTHTVHWNASAQASGIFFVALDAAGQRHVRKITLLK